RAAVGQLDRDQPVSDIRTLDGVLEDATGRASVITRALLAFGGLALLMASAGIYSVTSYLVSRRRREIGIRMALGASSARVTRFELAQAMYSVGLGLVAGFAAIRLTARLLHSLITGAETSSFAALLPAAVILSVLCGIAAWLPARKASRMDARQLLVE